MASTVNTAKKAVNFGDWYQQTLIKAEIIDYYPIAGCYIIRPWAYDMWETIKDFFDKEIKKLGVKNCYFPTFIPKKYLETEQNHVEGFAAEVAWVTKSGSSDLAEPIAIRPTSETCMYPSFANWVQSYRDLPLRLNQWCNVVRWEFSNPTPFIRSREFLWQEGHTAFATRDEAVTEVFDILELYRRVYEEVLAVPVIKGHKTEYEKFAGADFTTTIEAYIPAIGRSVQSATSHHLGQNFAKMFGIKFENPTPTAGGESHLFAHQNSWGLSTRSLGVLIMAHSDDTGLVLPPRVAPIQVAIVPCGLTAKATEDDKTKLFDAIKKIQAELEAVGIRVTSDFRDNVTPGWKFNYWEVKGVPIRFEVGPKDLAKNEGVVARRDKGKEGKFSISLEGIGKGMQAALDTMQQDMFNKLKNDRDAKIREVTEWKDFTPALNEKCILLCPCCDDKEVEIEVKKKSKAESEHQVDPGAPSMGAKSLCIPLEQKPLPEDAKCIITGKKATKWILFGRSY